MVHFIYWWKGRWQINIIEVSELVKRYGDLTAVNGISFAVKEGEVFGFLGPNGAGKSTTINILSTLTPPTSGQVRLGGFDVVREPGRVRSSIGLVFQDHSLDERLTAEENLYIHALLYGVTGDLYRQRLEHVLNMMDLALRRKSLVKTFSGGMKRRLEIARGLLHHPRVLFLDEPTVGLDPQTRKVIWDHVRTLSRELGTTVFMTTHYMDEAENCDRISIIDHGSIVALDTPAALKQLVGGDVVAVTAAGEDQHLKADLTSRYGVDVTETAGELSFKVTSGPEFIPRLAVDFQGRIGSLAFSRPTLEDVFIQLTGRAIREETVGAREQLRSHMPNLRRGRKSG